MGEPDGLFELRRTRNQAVVLPVSIVDRRIVPALHFVSRLTCSDSRALHISVDPAQTRRLAADWMNLGLSWLPLHIHDGGSRSVPAAVRSAVHQVASRADRVTVVLPELDFVRWWRPLRNQGTARRIAEQLHALPGVTAVVVPFYLQRPVSTSGREDQRQRQ